MAQQRRTPIAVVGPAYSGPSLDINAQECVNFIHSIDMQGGKAKVSLIGRYGLSLFAIIGSEPIRGEYAINPFGYVVAGNKLYRIRNDAFVETIGTLDTSSGSVGMEQNGYQLMIVDGKSGYIYTLVSADYLIGHVDAGDFRKIDSPDFSGGNDVSFIDHFFVVDNLDNGTVQVSGIDDGTSWNALDKATPESDPDGVVRCMSIHSTLWMAGEETLEPWYYAALPYGFPFLRQQGGVVDMGLAARWSMVSADNTLYWLGKNKKGTFGICKLNGYVAEKVSTPALDAEIKKYPTVVDCEAFSFTDIGHTFVYFIFPGANKSWCFDTSTGMWSEIRSSDVGAFKYSHHMVLNGKHILGDRTTGKLFLVDWEKYTDNGEYIEGVRTCRHIDKNGDMIEIPELLLDMETGVGNSDCEDPQVTLFVSRDGGHTWGNGQVRPVGKVGDYGKNIQWNRIGTGKTFTFKFRITDPVKRVIIGASGLIL